MNMGYEGLVLRQGDVWLKVKPEETHDVPIIGFIESKKRPGHIGAVMTPNGKVGVGFTIDERRILWTEQDVYKNVIMEVSCMQLTADGKFRHGRFVRFRWDKS